MVWPEWSRKFKPEIKSFRPFRGLQETSLPFDPMVEGDIAYHHLTSLSSSSFFTIILCYSNFLNCSILIRTFLKLIQIHLIRCQQSIIYHLVAQQIHPNLSFLSIAFKFKKTSTVKSTKLKKYVFFSVLGIFQEKCKYQAEQVISIFMVKKQSFFPFASKTTPKPTFYTQ